MNPNQSDLGSQQADALYGTVIRAARVDAPEECRMSGADRDPPAKVFAADVDELGIVGEGGSKRRAVQAFQAASS